MKSLKALIVHSIFRLSPRKGEFSIEKLGELSHSELGRPFGIEEVSYVSRFRRSLFSAVLEFQDELVRRGCAQTFVVSSSSALRLRWAGPDAGRGHLRTLELRACAARWLDGLSDRDFELACGHAMSQLGGTRVQVTEHGNEFGIDFFAIVPAFAKSSVFLSGARGLRIVGQAKKYSDPVTRDRIQAFNDTLNSVRNNRAELARFTPPWFRGSPSPILSCFVAHSGFQSGARTMANQAGILLLEALDLAEILARPKLFDCLDSKADIERALWLGVSKLAA